MWRDGVEVVDGDLPFNSASCPIIDGGVLSFSLYLDRGLNICAFFSVVLIHPLCVVFPPGVVLLCIA